MLNRRQTISLLALGSSAAAPALVPSALHAQDANAAPAQQQQQPPQSDGSAQPIPPFSRAALGDEVPPGWMHQRLPKVERANLFSIVEDGARRVLQVQSAQSSSSWVHRLDLDAGQRPWLHWQWKVSRALAGSDLRSKDGDDFAARLYVFFDLPPERLSLGDRLKLAAARALSGSELPAAALCYAWGHAQPVGASGPNPYTDRVRMVILDSQDAQAGRWRSHARDLRRDWAEAFGGAMPRVGGVAVGADTDNTGSAVTTWFGDLRLEAQA